MAGNAVARRKTTIYLDADLVRLVKVYAAQSGQKDSDVAEAAVREYFSLQVLFDVWERSALGADEAEALAAEALKEARSARKSRATA